MFIEDTSYYFGTLRKVSVAFGSIFNNINIQRFDAVGGTGNVIRVIHVPLSYAAGTKWYLHREQNTPAQEGVQTRISLPRIAFELTGFQYDAQRKLNTLNTTTCPDPENVSAFLRQLNPVPYDFSFDVHIAIKNIDDGNQILEQILPVFQPSYNLSVKDIPELSIVKDVPIILSGITKTDTFEGGYDTTRILEWTLSFVVKGYLYPPINDQEIIKKVIASLYKEEELENKSGVITAEVDPSDAAYDEEWTAKITKYDEDELDSNGDPI